VRYRNGQQLRLDAIAVRLSVNRRARRISIRIDLGRGEAVAVAPSERRLADAVAFVHDRRAWIAERLADRPESVRFAPGARIPLFGKPAPLLCAGGAAAARLVEHEGATAILSGGEGDAFARRVERLLRAEARRRLGERTLVHAAALGLKPPTVSIGDPKSRWGSCSPHRNAIRYSWRLVMAPPEVLDYVAAHEVAHLVHADHSPAYWAVVRAVFGDPKPHRAWLRTHGAALHAAGR